MAAGEDPFEAVRRLTERPDVLRQIDVIRRITGRPGFVRQMDAIRRIALPTELLDRMNSISSAASMSFVERLPKFSVVMPETWKPPALGITPDLTRIVSGSSAATAFADSQAISARVAETFKPATTAWAEKALEPFRQDILGISERLTESTRALARLRMPTLLSQATSDSTRAWRMVVDDLPPSPSILAVERASFAGTHTLTTSTAARLLLPVDDDVINVEVLDDEAAIEDALEIGDRARAGIRDRLGAVHPRLMARLDGAWTTLAASGPDAASQAAHSIQELIDGALRELASDKAVLTWYKTSDITKKPGQDLYEGRPTRSLKARYLARSRPQHAHAASLFCNSIGAISKVLQGAKHTIDHGHGPDVIQLVLLQVEAFFGFVLLDD